ncbi:hypothetical protein BD626DRAFT_259616 [Schizophyllum amplum]|uniref:Uncharacterized protein n=1 Tax=Schizophyllum amplum TaxID=97359 RepID=A0A550BUI0_9AGAR|nr:hypothetical protein BD626DRAFT_259616 [Auriculariopsis ampla]
MYVGVCRAESCVIRVFGDSAGGVLGDLAGETRQWIAVRRARYRPVLLTILADPCLQFSTDPCLRFSADPCLQFSTDPCLRFSVDPCFTRDTRRDAVGLWVYGMFHRF